MVTEDYDKELSNWDRLPAEPMVSVSMITYQHAPYIRQALDSVLMQQTDFPYEICVGEDGSTDGTREICKEYAEKHPDKIRLFLRDRSNPAREKYCVPFMHNGVETMRACRGKYIASLEGDDYWTDPQKLKKQVNVLEARPDAFICHHSYDRLHDYLKDPRMRLQPAPDDYPPEGDIYYFAEHRLPRTLTVMSRNIDFSEVFELLEGALVGDRIRFLYLAALGPALFIKENMAVYRLHSGGVSHADGGLKGLIRSLDSSLYVVRLAEKGVFDSRVKDCTLRYLETVLAGYIAPNGLKGDELSIAAARLAKHFKPDNWMGVAYKVSQNWKRDKEKLKKRRAYRFAEWWGKKLRRLALRK